MSPRRGSGRGPGAADADPQGPAPVTLPIRTGWQARLDPTPALRRVRDSAIPIAQIVVAATAAYAVAAYVFGHPAPLLAATVTVSSLGLVRDARPRRVLETVIGMLVGIIVAELLLLVAGSGWWQLALALGATLVVAVHFDERESAGASGFAVANDLGFGHVTVSFEGILEGMVVSGPS